MEGHRTIILHYHLFKNAGSSVDEILKTNFARNWEEREFPMDGENNSCLVENWIQQTPNMVAYSSHTMMGPPPEIEGTKIISFALLRDPIERIKSAYRFERQQRADTWGARLAKQHDFESYVRARLDRSGDRQCRNFQTHRLASLAPGEGTELERAKKGIRALTLVGQVDEFDSAMASLQNSLKPSFPNFVVRHVRANTAREKSALNCGREFLPWLRTLNSDEEELLLTLKRHSR